MRVEIPKPIGEKFCHRYRNGTIQHHETDWKYGRAVCKICGIEAIETNLPVKDFLNDEIRLEGLQALMVD